MKYAPFKKGGVLFYQIVDFLSIYVYTLQCWVRKKQNIGRSRISGAVVWLYALCACAVRGYRSDSRVAT